VVEVDEDLYQKFNISNNELFKKINCLTEFQAYSILNLAEKQ
jgi:hypothetical protein